MRQQLIDLINATIVYCYDLANPDKEIERVLFSNENDLCYLASNNDYLIDIIYNSIVEYSFNEFDLTQNSFDNLLSIALQSKIRYDPAASDDTKQKYGFLGEVLLFSVLAVHFKARPLIARGYFYNPLEKSETKGYDSYHLINNNGVNELWFGEVKFYVNYRSAVDKVVGNLEKAISDEYLSTNIIALNTHRNNFNLGGSPIDAILSAWNANPSIILSEEIKKHKMKLVYPVLLLYQQGDSGYDDSIDMVVKYIKDKYASKHFNLSIEYSIFFIMLPLKEVAYIKTRVIEWIESKRPLI